MVKFRTIILDSAGIKYPVIAFNDSHQDFFITTIIGDERALIKTIKTNDFKEHVSKIEDYFNTLGTAIEYKILEKDKGTRELIDNFRNWLSQEEE